jgi:hypothetical protein
MYKKILLLSAILVTIFSAINAQQHKVTFEEKLLIKESKINSSYQEVSLQGLSKNRNEGEPNLPIKYVNIVIPYSSIVSDITITSNKTEIYNLQKPILPTQKDIPIGLTSDVFIKPSQSIYNNSTLFPTNIIEVFHEGYYDHVNHVVTLAICPFEYNPKTNQLIYYKEIDFTVSTKTKKRSSEQFYRNRDNRVQRLYEKALSSLVINPTSISTFQMPVSVKKTRSLSTFPNYEYVIITTDDLEPHFFRFVNWKRRKGIDIGVVTLSYIYSNFSSGDTISGISDNAGSIRQFLYDAYLNGTVYCLLAGDHLTVPIRYGYVYNNTTNSDYIIPCDYYFSDFNGDWNVDGDANYGEWTEDAPDFNPEIFIGRLMCSTKEHIDNWTEKVIIYESNPGNGDYSYLTRAFYTEADQLQRDNCVTTIASSLSFITSDTVFRETYGGVLDHNSANAPEFPTGADVISEFNNNYGLVSFMGHGGPFNVAVATKGHNDGSATKERVYTYESYYPSLTGGSFESMTNQQYPNIYYSISCKNMPFDDLGHASTIKNIGEGYTALFKTGGVAFLGNTRNGWVSTSPGLFQDFAGEISSGITNLGIAEANSIVSCSDRRLKYAHNLIGCPETSMWTAIPSSFTNVTVTESGNNVTINTGGVSDCKICVMSILDNGESYWEVEDSASNHTFSSVVKPYCVTVTKQNYIPYLYNQDVYIQNHTFTESTYISGRNIYVGYDVTNSISYGNVTIKNGANIFFDAEQNFEIKNGFECELGGTFEVIKK